jgi:hypothetical protein
MAQVSFIVLSSLRPVNMICSSRLSLPMIFASVLGAARTLTLRSMTFARTTTGVGKDGGWVGKGTIVGNGVGVGSATNAVGVASGCAPSAQNKTPAEEKQDRAPEQDN